MLFVVCFVVNIFKMEEVPRAAVNVRGPTFLLETFVLQQLSMSTVSKKNEIDGARGKKKKEKKGGIPASHETS